MPLNPKAKFEITASDKTKAALKSARQGFNQTVGRISKYATVAGTIAVAATAKLTAAQFKAIDATAKLADRIGGTTESITGLRHAAELTGAGGERLGEAIDVLQKRLGEAAQGTGQAKDALDQLGLSAQELLGMDPAEQFRMISERVSGLATQQEKSAATSDLFSRANLKLVNTLELGRKGLDEVQQRAEDLNLTYSRFDAAKIEQANDAVTEAKTAFTGLGNTIAIKVAPFVTAIAQQFTEAAARSGGFEKQVSSAFEKVMKTVGFVADAIHGLKVVFLGIRQVIAEWYLFVIRKLRDLANNIRDTLNPILEFMGRDPIEFKLINGIAESFEITVKRFREELEAAATEPLPSKGLEEFAAKAIKTANEAAAAATSKGGGDKDGTSNLPGGGLTDDKVQDQLNKIREFVKGREQIEIEAHARRVEMVMTHMQDGESRRRLLERLAKKHHKKLTDIAKEGTDARVKMNKMEWQGQLSTIAGAMQKMTGLMDSNSKDSFERKKKAAKATAIVSTASAVVQSFQNAGGYPWGLIPAGLMLAAGYKQIQNIDKQKYNGGGGAANAGSVAGGGSSGVNQAAASANQTPAQVPNLQQQQQQTQQRQVNITVSGPVDRQFLKDALLPALREEIDENDVTFIGSNSAQARELKEAS